MLIVEDGTSVQDANTYVSLEDADAFFTDRANTTWTTASSVYREAALIKATDYIEAMYMTGAIAATTYQGLTYPIVNNTANTTIPKPLMRSVMLLAVEALAGPLSPTQSDRLVTAEEKTLAGVGTTKTAYSTSKQARFPAVDALMASIGRTRSSSSLRSIPVNRV